MTPPGSPAFEVALEQRYQRLAGRAIAGDAALPLHTARLSGDAISFAFHDPHGVQQSFTGRLAGDRMGGANGAWTADRIGPGG